MLAFYRIEADQAQGIGLQDREYCFIIPVDHIIVTATEKAACKRGLTLRFKIY